MATDRQEVVDEFESKSGEVWFERSANWTYCVLTATNLNVPIEMPAATNGNFSLTLSNAVNPAASQMFYRR